MSKDCCKICETLPLCEGTTPFLKQKRSRVKRWGQPYTQEEMDNIWDVLLENYNTKEKHHKTGRLRIPESSIECIGKLAKKSNRPSSGFIAKLLKIGILSYYKPDKYYFMQPHTQPLEFSNEFLERIKNGRN